MSGIASETLSALRRHRWAIFAVLTVGYFFVYFHRISVSVVGQDIVADVGGSIGFLSSVYYWTYTLLLDLHGHADPVRDHGGQVRT